MKLKTSQSGFTLVELIIVIGIISILSGIILTSLTGSKAKSRDAARVSDLNQIQLALEQYFDRCGQYPINISDTSAQNGCPSVNGTQITFGSYISVIPKDPSTSLSFDYIVNGSYTDYVLHTTLENSNAAQQNSYPKTAFANFLTNNGITFSFPTTWSTQSCFDSSTAPKDYCVSTK